jgi:putative membrane protein
MILVPNKDRNLHLFLWSVIGIVFAWSYIGCRDRLTWFLEVLPVIIGTVILLMVYRKFRFTRVVCWFLCLHAIVLMVGGHYTYANVPFMDWIRDSFHLARNDYDRIGHFFQGFVPALIAREILTRQNVVQRKGWRPFIVVCICLAISASYELFEWRVAVATGARSDAFLGSQGDPWDTQWDMASAFIGAVASLVFLSRLQDREIARIQ